MIRTPRLWLLLLCSACSHRGPPSPEFQKAQARYAQLYGQKLDDAFVDPAMDDVVDLLSRVPDNSVDAPAAQEMLKRISDARAAAQARSDALQKDLAALKQAPVGAFAPDRPSPPAPPAPAGPSAPFAAVDTGGPNEPAAGMAVADFKNRWGDCFEPGPPVNVVGVGTRDAYVLQNRVRCLQALPGFDARVVVADGTTILTVTNKSALIHHDPPDAGPAAAPAAAPEAPDAGSTGSYQSIP